MPHNFFHVLGKCIWHKAFWCCLGTLITCLYLLCSHSYRACAVTLLVVLLGVFSMYEEFNETAEAADTPARAQDH